MPDRRHHHAAPDPVLQACLQRIRYSPNRARHDIAVKRLLFELRRDLAARAAIEKARLRHD